MKLVKSASGNHAQLISLIVGVELRISKAAAERDGVLAHRPDGVGGRIEAVLENSGKRSLGGRSGPDIHVNRRTAWPSYPANTVLMPGKMVGAKVY